MDRTRVLGTLVFSLALLLAPTTAFAQEHDDGHEGGCEGGHDEGDEGGCEGGHDEGDEGGCEGGHDDGHEGGGGHGGPGPMVCRTDLVSGRNHIVVGYLVVRERRCVEGGYNVTFHANPGYCLAQTHLHVVDDGDEIPVTRSGNPVPGLFEHAQPHACVDRVRYPFESFEPGTVLAAHAVMGPDGETAWAEGEPFDGRSWAMYVVCGQPAP